MATVKFEMHEVDKLLDAVTKASQPDLNDVAAVVSKGALNIKNDARRRARGLKHAPAYPSSITYDTYFSLRGPTAEIGPDKTRRQGALGNLIEYGSVNNPPHPHLRPAADREQPRFEKALEDLSIKMLGLG